jgi:hypothetical protein
MSVTLLHPHPVHYPSPTLRYLCRSLWSSYSTPTHLWRIRCDALLATEHPLSVIPPTIRNSLDLAITPVKGWKGRTPDYFGIPCRIGRVTVWLPVENGLTLYREFSMLVLLPKNDLEEAAPFIHLGAQFLLESQAQLVLDVSSASNFGQLVIP